MICMKYISLDDFGKRSFHVVEYKNEIALLKWRLILNASANSPTKEYVQIDVTELEIYEQTGVILKQDVYIYSFIIGKKNLITFKKP